MFGTDDIDQGSLGTHVVWKEDYLFLIPAEISPADAAPLMCAGATIFAALYDNNVMSTDTIGVVGIGGLGHLAIQFAAKMGCRVVVFSSTEDKREEAMKLGATDFYATRGLDKLEIPHSIDYMLVTTSYLPSWDLYLGVMTKQGTIIPFTVSSGNMEIPSTPFLFNGLKIVSSFVATRYVQYVLPGSRVS